MNSARSVLVPKLLVCFGALGALTALIIAQAPNAVVAILLGGVASALCFWVLRRWPQQVLCWIILPSLAVGALGTFEVGGGTVVTPTQLLLVLVIGMYALGCLTQHRASELPLWKSFGAYWAVVVLSVLPAVNRFHWLRGLLDLTLAYGCLVYAYFELRTRAQLERVLKIQVALGVACSLFGFLQYWFIDSVRSLFGLLYADFQIQTIESRFVQGYGTSNWAEPADFGSFLNLSAPLALYLLLKARSRRMVALWGAAYLLIASGVVLTATRAVMIAFVLSSVLLVALVRVNVKRVVIPALVFAVVISMSLAFAHSLERFDLNDASNEVTLEQRSLLRLEALYLFVQNPVVGVGARNFSDRGFFVDDVTTAHNLVMQVAAETGILGLVTLFVLFTRLCFPLKKARSEGDSNDLRHLRYALFCPAVAILTESMAQNSFFVWQIGALFWLLQGASFAVAARPKDFAPLNGTPRVAILVLN